MMYTGFYPTEPVSLIATTVRHDSRIAVTIVSIVFPACHVLKSYSVDPFFRWGRGTMKGSSMKIRNPASDGIREKKVCNSFIIFYLIMYS